MEYTLSSEIIAALLVIIGIIITISLQHLKTHEGLKDKIHELDKKQTQIDTLLSVTKIKGEKITDNIYQQEGEE